MQTAITISQNTTAPAPIVQADATAWHHIFSRQQALASVAAHISALPSSQTDEKYTAQVYESGIRFWLEWAGDQLPTKQLVKAYIAALGRGINRYGDERTPRKPSTISSKYLAPLRLYLRELADQHVTPAGSADREAIETWRRHIEQAAKVRNPPPTNTTNIAPLWRADFVRLNHQQVNAVLRGIDCGTIAGLRDYALLIVAFETALRVAELSRITLDAITREGDTHIITVRGKRNNVDPVPLSSRAVDAINDYVAAFNFDLHETDKRRITATMPLWQPLTKTDRQRPKHHYNPATGISRNSIGRIIRKRTAAILGEENALAPHDTRRTAAAIAYEAGMPLTDIQQLLRHKNAAITLGYVGEKPDFASRSLSTYVTFG